MRNIISALIIDPLKEEHNYDDVKVYKQWDTYEDGFDIKVLKNADNILKELNKFRGVDCIITIGDVDCTELNALSFDFRKKWIHYDDFNANDIANGIISVFKNNIGRVNPYTNKTFSFFTCTFNTDEKLLKRLYDSMKAQTYNDWDWFILDDSTNANTRDIIKGWNDPRITVLSNITNHGSIGFNKHMVAMMCDGEYLVEVDHDDELLPHCLEKLKEAFDTYPDTSFVYSHCLELIDNDRSVWYGDDWGKDGWGGGYGEFNVKGVVYNMPLTADITPVSIRTIFTQPNHIRCWKKDFYHKIGGHNPELSVLDDAEILIRTFLNGKMTKIDDVLYIQHEDDKRGDINGSNTQSKRFKEIQRSSQILKQHFDNDVHERIVELGYYDCVWNDDGYSELHSPKGDINVMNNILLSK